MKKLALLAAPAGSLAATDAARAGTVMHDANGNVVLDAAPGETNTAGRATTNAPEAKALTSSSAARATAGPVRVTTSATSRS